MATVVHSTTAPAALETVVFRSALGWISLAGHDSVLYRVSFGHRSREDALGALVRNTPHSARNSWNTPLVERLQAYADGQIDDFTDVEVNVDHLTRFARRVVEATRRIHYGETRSYQAIAVAAGNPRAARAVGGVMAGNRIPLVVPCHRVVGSGGKLGGFSAIDGLAMKRRLLALESRSLFVI
jgi:methylated-DNA-[protein]-cysteine S-methyltransferase